MAEVTEEQKILFNKRLREIKLMIATPMYGGQCFGTYTESMIRWTAFAQANGIQYSPHFLFNESLVARARNYCAAAFMKSDFTHFLFIDSDVQFTSDDILKLLFISLTHEDKRVVCGVYPKKEINWEFVKKAILNDPNIDEKTLQKLTGQFVFNKQTKENFNIGEPLKVDSSGTGFMLIERSVFDEFMVAYPETEYFPDHDQMQNENKDAKIFAFFMDQIDEESKRHLSEDYMFCKMIAKIGIDTWLLPYVSLGHNGFALFQGDFKTMAVVDNMVNEKKTTKQKVPPKKSKKKFR